MPTWALALLVVAALGGSAWLFWGDLTGDDEDRQATTTPTPAATVDESADELSLPDDTEPTDERRRGTQGRERLDSEVPDDPDRTDADTPAGADADAGEQPATYANLRDARITLLAASSEGTGNAARLVRVQGLRVPCATPGPKDALTVELAALTLMSERLDAAQAAVVGDRSDRFGAATCVNDRVAKIADADVAIVVRVTPSGDAARVIAGRPTGTSVSSSTTLAAEIAAALDLAAVTPSTSAATRTLLANTGAIDSPDGASVVLVELPAKLLVEDGALDAAVDDIVGAIAAHLSRADEQAG